MLILSDTRLGDHLNSQVISLLVKFLDDKKDCKFQLYSAIALEFTVFSKVGCEFKDISVPYLVNLISSPNLSVRSQALFTLITIAQAYPECCNAMIEHKALDLLESILTEKNNYYEFELLEYAGGLLAVFCQFSPHLLSDKMQKVIGTISIAIEYRQSWSVVMNISLALSILTDQGLVEIRTAVIRLLELINHSHYYVVISSLRTIGNYVRWGSDEDIKFMIERGLLPDLQKLLCHEYTMVRKEACWIISNITAVANISQIQEIIDVGFIDTLVGLVRIEKFELKKVAASAISNIVRGSDKEQYAYLKEKCFPLLSDLRFHYRHVQPVVTLCTELLQLDNIRAHMTSGTTADRVSASAKYARRFKKFTKKKNGRCKKLSTVASPADPFTDLTGDLDSEEIVYGEKPLSVDSTEELGSNKKCSNEYCRLCTYEETEHLPSRAQKVKLKKGKKLPDTASKNLGSKSIKGNKFERGKKLFTAALSDSSTNSTEDLDFNKNSRVYIDKETEHLPRCAQKIKFKTGKKLPNSASENLGSKRFIKGKKFEVDKKLVTEVLPPLCGRPQCICVSERAECAKRV